MRQNKIKTLKLALILLTVVALSMGALPEEEPFPIGERKENVEESGMGALIAGLVTGPYKLAIERHRAKKLVASLPDYEGTVDVPDSETIYSWIEGVCRTPHRRAGTPEGNQAEYWVADRMREVGLQNVTMDPIPLKVWTAERWSLTAAGEDVPCFYIVYTGFTGPAGISAPLIYLGTGRPKDFDRVDVKDKIVVVDMPILELPTGALMKITRGYYALSDPERQINFGYSQYLTYMRSNFPGYTEAEHAPENDAYWQAYKRGAAGICFILEGYPNKTNAYYAPYDGVMKPMPGLYIGHYEGERLRELARQGSQATLVLQGRIEKGVTHNVWGVLPGTSDEVILVTSHHDSPFQGAVEDGSGVANVLAQAWAWSRVPREKRPKTMVFVIDSGHFYGSLGAFIFAREHKDIMERTKILFTLEHLAAKGVTEQDGQYVPTGDPELTILFTSHDPLVIAAVIKGLKDNSLKATVSLPIDMFGPTPSSDAAGYVLEAGVPAISWITGPAYLIDEHDTLDKIDKDRLEPIAQTIAGMIGTFMAMD